MKAPLPYCSGPLPRFLWGNSLYQISLGGISEQSGGDRNPRISDPYTFPPFHLPDQRRQSFVRISGREEHSGLGEIEEEDRTVWKTNLQLYATDFIFFDQIPDNSTMRKMMQDACIDRQIRKVFFRVLG